MRNDFAGYQEGIKATARLVYAALILPRGFPNRIPMGARSSSGHRRQESLRKNNKERFHDPALFEHSRRAVLADARPALLARPPRPSYRPRRQRPCRARGPGVADETDSVGNSPARLGGAPVARGPERSVRGPKPTWKVRQRKGGSWSEAKTDAGRPCEIEMTILLVALPRRADADFSLDLSVA